MKIAMALVFGSSAVDDSRPAGQEERETRTWFQAHETCIDMCSSKAMTMTAQDRALAGTRRPYHGGCIASVQPSPDQPTPAVHDSIAASTQGVP